jgi:serine/threonine protein phosphatase PrpC
MVAVHAEPASDGERLPSLTDRALGALTLLLRESHMSGPNDLPELVSASGAQLGAVCAQLYVVDYDQLLLVPLVLADPAGDAAQPVPPVPIEGTLAGRAYTDLAQQLSVAGDEPVLWTAMLDGTERIGVLQLIFANDETLSEEMLAVCRDLAGLLAELVVTRSAYGDAVQKARRRLPMTVPAELQWRLLPPLTFICPRATVAAVVAPTNEIAGDSFDYALNGEIFHVAIIDAMGHGMEATLLSAVATSALRNARRGGKDLAATVALMDTEISKQFGSDKFCTGIVGELDVSTGWWRWITCGHPPALLLRGGNVVKSLESAPNAPIGLGLLDEPVVGQERLEPGDRLILYTDGVTEARDREGNFFGTEKLVQFAARQASSARPAAEMLRRLNHAILAHQEGELQDDATTVMVEWLSDQPAAISS